MRRARKAQQEMEPDPIDWVIGQRGVLAAQTDINRA
jgi:hypothetical protein